MIYIYMFWVNYNDLTVLPHRNDGLIVGNHPDIAELFSLVNPCNSPRCRYR